MVTVKRVESVLSKKVCTIKKNKTYNMQHLHNINWSIFMYFNNSLNVVKITIKLIYCIVNSRKWLTNCFNKTTNVFKVRLWIASRESGHVRQSHKIFIAMYHEEKWLYRVVFRQTQNTSMKISLTVFFYLLTDLN